MAAVRLIGSLYIYIYSEAGGAAGRPGGAAKGQQGTARGGEPGRGQEATKAIARRYFDFFRDVPRRIIGFEAISGRGGGQNVPFSLNPSAGGPANLRFSQPRRQYLTTFSAFLTSWLF